ncbi:protein GRIM REAPER [Juglans regia]|uniref:Protein GRIM REAPER n=1 Tax=Juglans regia TaxID=51240 RepID=A0A2I4ESZ2_JUGRE|nr:protein GRIM REAPER [Juglans regia]
MACTLLKLTTILSLIMPLIITFLALHSQLAFSNNIEEDDEDQYVLDSPLMANINLRSSRSRFLASVIKKGARCHPITNNVCNGIPANNGTSLLYCCKKHCRNILGDRNNCGRCGRKCKQGQRCCNRICTDITSNENHCGKCHKKCAKGVNCELGFCGYA